MIDFFFEYLWYVLICSTISVFAGATYGLKKRGEGFGYIILLAFVFGLTETVFGVLLSVSGKILNIMDGINILLALFSMVLFPWVRDFYIRGEFKND